MIVCLQLTGGSVVAIMLADAIDEWGLGFGYGAWILYALGYIATEVHRLAGYLASTPSGEALYRPLFIWAVATVGVVAAGVAVLLAVRRLAINGSEVDIRLMTPGVFRPAQFALAVMFIPSIFANYYVATNPNAGHWLSANWALFGGNVWLDAVYGVVEAAVIVLFALFATTVDYLTVPTPTAAVQYWTRLAVLGGAFLALATVGVRVVVHFLTPWPETPIPVSGFDVVFVTAVILAVVRAIDGFRATPPYTVTPLGVP